MIKYIKFPFKVIQYAFWQNDYLYPKSPDDTLWYPYRKKHLWRTRIGFKTAWGLARVIVDV